MKRFIKFNLKLILVFALVFTSIFGVKTSSKNSNIALANETKTEQQNIDNMSIFIRKPAYSCFMNNKLYFIDEYDNLLKVYDTVSSTFEKTVEILPKSIRMNLFKGECK